MLVDICVCASVRPALSSAEAALGAVAQIIVQRLSRQRFSASALQTSLGTVAIPPVRGPNWMQVLHVL
jgi:hypothetical protein